MEKNNFKKTIAASINPETETFLREYFYTHVRDYKNFSALISEILDKWVEEQQKTISRRRKSA